MQLSFTKMNGAGNDFIMLDNRDGTLVLDASHIALLCDRHRGIGADGVLAVEAASKVRTFGCATTMQMGARQKCAVTERAALRVSLADWVLTSLRSALRRSPGIIRASFSETTFA